MLGLKDLTIDDIKALADVMNEKRLGKIELVNGESSVTISGMPTPPPPPPPHHFEGMPSMPAGAPMGMPQIIQPAPMPETKSATSSYDGNVVKAPIVGTYYCAPAPGRTPFVTVGQHVSKGDTIMIIESMKLMNEVQSEFDGVVTEIITKDGQPVEYDQPIMVIK